MTEGYGAYPQVGRKTPAAGAHVFIGHPNVFFVTINAKDKVPWLKENAADWLLQGRVHDVQWIGD